MNTDRPLAEVFPIWDSLRAEEQKEIEKAAFCRTVEKGTIVHNGSSDCLGLVLVCNGQLRSYILSEEGREITLYRLLEQDACLFSASCMLRDIQFEIILEAEKETAFWVIPSEVYERIMRDSTALSNYTNALMAGRFSDVMWLLEQIMWKRFDQRLANFLLEESALEDTTHLHITHEAIAKHMGSAREVVTRMLRYFQEEGFVALSRGTIEIRNENGLRSLTQAD